MKSQDARYIAETAALLQARAINAGLSRGTHVAARDALELHRLATRFHRWQERRCNEDLTCSKCVGDGRIRNQQPKTGAPCGCKRGVERDNCPACEGTGLRIDFQAVRTGTATKPCPACAGRGDTLGKREAKAEARAREIAQPYRLRVYLQGDCRGCPVYLLPEESGPQSEDDSRYNQRGHAVPHLG